VPIQVFSEVSRCGRTRWIARFPGSQRPHDDATYRQRFVPGRPRSAWSVRNTGLVERFADAGRMRARGQAEVDRARADGRWPAD